MNTTDGDLLRSYARLGSETAFEELVRRHLDLVYSAALRQTDGSAHLAEDVMQSVFTDLARKAATLARHPSLAGWLYTSTRFVAAQLRRTDQRRRAREREALAMNTSLQNAEPEPDWAQIRPLLDDAMHTLEEPDREAVLLRHFEGQPYAEIGARLGWSENAARMRVERALEKLRAALARSEVTSTALALAACLSTNAVSAAPDHLARHLVGKALAGATGTGGLLALASRVFTASKAKWAALLIGAATIVGLVVLSHRTQSGPAGAAASSLASATNRLVSAAGPVSPPLVPAALAALAAGTNDAVLHLKVVAADSGQPIPRVQVFHPVLEPEVLPNFGAVLAVRMVNDLRTDRAGHCDVYYPRASPGLNLALRLDGFADTRLLWRPEHGDVIPTNYVVRMDRAVPIGGRVVDPEGKPVAGARVAWSSNGNSASLVRPQYHGLISSNPRLQAEQLIALSGPDGHWQINRIAADLLPQCYGVAEDSNYVSSDGISPGEDLAAEKKLRDGTYVFHLKPAALVAGLVVDPEGTPVPGAKVAVGNRLDSLAAEGTTRADGTFRINNCPPGKLQVTAQAKGYGPTTVETETGRSSESLRLVLKHGNVLRLRVEDESGKPIPRAHAFLSPWTLPMASVGNSDADGRIVWSNAPAGNLTLSLGAAGFMSLSSYKVRADGQEHIVTLAPELVVYGTVRNRSNGQSVPKFRILTACPETDAATGTTNLHWNSPADFWSNGRYRATFSQPLVSVEGENPSYVLRFEAAGYAPWDSPPISAEERNVRLDVLLQPANPSEVTLYKPNGEVAGNVTIGFVSAVNHFRLGQDGFVSDANASLGLMIHSGLNGAFNLSTDPSVVHVIAASVDGYAEATPSALRKSGLMQLQPWGRLEVTCLAGNQPAAGREYQLDLSGGPFDHISFQTPIRVKTDAEGRFSVSELPPGHYQLTRDHPDRFMFFKDWLPGEQASIEIRPGKTTELTLGAHEVTVTARLIWPAGIQRQPAWQMIARLSTPLPHPPAGLGEADRTAFYRSAAYRAAFRGRREYPMVLKGDDTLAAEEVQPGNYDLSVVIGQIVTNQATPNLQLNLERHAQARMPVTVPADAPDGVFHAGTVALKVAGK